MRPTRVTVNSQTFSQWIPLNYLELYFGVGLAGILASGGTATWQVQETLDDIAQSAFRPVIVSRSGTVATVTDSGPSGLGHGLSVADSVIIKGTGSSVLDSPQAAYGQGDLGWNVASIVSATQYTFTCANSGPTADNGVSTGLGLRVFPHPTLTAQTARAFGIATTPVTAVRLNVTAWTSGAVELLVVQGMGR